MRTRRDGMTANSQIYSIKTPPSDKNPIKINSLMFKPALSNLPKPEDLPKDYQTEVQSQVFVLSLIIATLGVGNL